MHITLIDFPKLNHLFNSLLVMVYYVLYSYQFLCTHFKLSEGES
jgi:hypothetical protein